MTTHFAAHVRKSRIPGTSILDCSGGRAVSMVLATEDEKQVTCRHCLRKLDPPTANDIAWSKFEGGVGH